MEKFDKVYYAIIAGLMIVLSVMVTIVIIGLANKTVTANSGGILAIMLVSSATYSLALGAIKRYWNC